MCSYVCIQVTRVSACMCLCVCVCARACVRACVCACVFILLVLCMGTIFSSVHLICTLNFFMYFAQDVHALCALAAEFEGFVFAYAVLMCV
jgi:hypothetical protein